MENENEKAVTGRQEDLFLPADTVLRLQLGIPYGLLALAVDYSTHWNGNVFLGSAFAGIALVGAAPEVLGWERETHTFRRIINTIGHVRRQSPLSLYTRGPYKLLASGEATSVNDGGEETEALPSLERRFQTYQDEEDVLQPPSSQGEGAIFHFSQILQQGFVPSLDALFLGRMEDGTMMYCKSKDLCHVALAGATGNGKSSIMRMLMSQLCVSGARVLLLNPHYTRYDLESGEDWTPFERYLEYDPMQCRKYETIEYYLKQVATDLLPKRLAKYAHSQPLGRPYFLVLDELPAIVKHVPDAPKYLEDILREGRKVGIFLITAAQDFLVKTIAPQGGGAIRDCYRTAFYVGGDSTTAKILLDLPIHLIEEDVLGKGVVMLRNATVKRAKMVRVPYMDNQSLYALLGPSTYKPAPTSEPDDDLCHVTTVAKSTPAVAPVKRQSGQLTLELILSLADQGKIDPDTMLSLIDRLPVVDADDERYAETDHDQQIVRGNSRILPDLPRQEIISVQPVDEELEKAVVAYRNGATSINKMAAALEIKPYYAGPLLERAKKEAEKRQAAGE